MPADRRDRIPAGAGSHHLGAELLAAPGAEHDVGRTARHLERIGNDAVAPQRFARQLRKAVLAARPGWAAIPAVRSGYVREIKSSLILQPGPAALTDGVAAIQAVIAQWEAGQE